MALERFLIAPMEVGLENDLKPWIIPDTAFEQLNNAYIFRGRVRKRFGSKYMTPITPATPGYEQYPSRLAVPIGTTPGPIMIAGTSAALPLKIGQTFTVGTDVFTITAVGAAALTLSTNSPATATINTTSTPNTVTFTGEPGGTQVLWYPSLPVMGLITWETGVINNAPTIAFDTQFAYQFTSTGWQRLALENESGAATWTGSDSQFFWGYTYQGVNLSESYLFVTNYNGNEPNYMRYLDTSFTWNNFRPQTDSSGSPNYINSCRIIVGFKSRLVLLNTIETSGTYLNRARYSASNMSPIDDSGAHYFPFIDNNDDQYFIGGGAIDNLQTQEAIISAEFIKDRLIVFYEKSTWELVYTGNYEQPFIWQQINTELGAQSTFSKVPFDKQVLAIGQVGIHSCSGTNVTRIDDRIPDDVFEIQNINAGPLRVQGIRDYFVEQVYWAMPLTQISSQTPYSQVYPNQVLVYNYKTGSWAYNTDSFTAFGYFTQQPELNWGNLSTTWMNETALWSDGSLASNFRNVIGGNQEGYVLIIDSETTRNAGALQITDATATGSLITLTVVNHNLVDVDILTNQEEFVLIENVIGSSSGPGTYSSLNGGIYPIVSITGTNTITIAAFPISDAYLGGGTVARVSNPNILSKQWNPYNKQGQNVFIQKIDFLVDRTGGIDEEGTPYGGQVTVDYYPSTSKYSMLNNSVPGQLTSTGVLETSPYDPAYYPLESVEDRLWHPLYFACDGTAIQIRIYMTADQMINPMYSLSDFQLHAIILYAQPTSFRMGG